MGNKEEIKAQRENVWKFAFEERRKLELWSDRASRILCDCEGFVALEGFLAGEVPGKAP